MRLRVLSRIEVLVKSVVRVKLRVTPEQSAALSRTLTLCNQAANVVSTVAFSEHIAGAKPLQRRVYGEVKAQGLSAQPALHVIRKVADAYTTLRGNARAGNLGKKGSRRWNRAMGKPVVFRDDAAQAFDDRCLSWQLDKSTVSIWSVDGRLKDIPLVGNPEHLTRLRQSRKGETDLVVHQGDWFLVATLDEPDPALMEPVGFLGVDLGIANIATTSDGVIYSGKTVNRVRHKNRRLRTKLQKKGTKSAKRVLKRLSGREARFSTNTNHVISKQIVTEAQRTGRGIAIEDLTGIRDRVRLRKPQRVTLHSWAFAQLGAFLTYKAHRAGVPLLAVDPAYSSQECHDCHYVDKGNRTNQATFACLNCGVTLHADINAGLNLAHRGTQAWGAVSLPHAA